MQLCYRIPTFLPVCPTCRIFRHIAEVRCQEQLRNVRKHCFKCGSKAGTKSRTSSGQEQPARAYASNKVSEAMEPAWVDTILLRYAMYAKVIMIIKLSLQSINQAEEKEPK